MDGQSLATPGGDLLWAAPQWAVPVAVIASLLAALVLWGYLRPEASGPIRFLAAALKLLAIALLAVCVLEPMRSGTRPRPQANVLPILVDNSQSMQLKLSSDQQSRYRSVAAQLAEDASWRVRIAQAFDVRQYAFDARLESVDDLTTLAADGYLSSLATSLQSLADRFAGRPVAGVILFSDGNLTDPPQADFDWSTLGFPVYPVLPQSDGDARDLRIADVSIRQTDFESAPVTVNLSIDAIGMSGETVVVELRDLASGKTTEEKTLRLGDPETPQEVRFRFRPEQPGVSFFSAAVFCEDDRDEVHQPSANPAPPTREATLLNNRRILTIDRATGPYRILYLAGRPNWEFKFLRRALQEDAEVQLVGLLRVARKEPKFSFRDAGVSGTNPLFAGLGEAEEEAAQQYDEPVIIRLGVRESEELSAGFPDSAEELFAYHGVILDDIETEFFSQDQLLLLRRFVSSRGGGLLLLGGTESFAREDFGQSPLGELSPVYAPSGSADKSPGPYRFSLTREGLLQPWARLRDNENDERGRLESMPPFLTLNAVGDVKPGASPLAVATSNDGATAPALIAQRFGKGRTAAITLGDLWRWSMRRDDSQRDDPAQAWRQLAHWLVNDVPRRVELRVDAGRDPSQPVTILATARDEAYLPLDNATVELTIEPLEGEPLSLTAEMHGSEPGVYTASYWARQPGGYRVLAKVTAADGSFVGTASSGWTAEAGAAEFRDLRPNRQWLQQMAEATGGEVIREDRLQAFANDLPSRKVPVTETWVYPLWHRAWVMSLAMICLCCEWGLRRWKGLA
jgi:uncharacterized membrane protein